MKGFFISIEGGDGSGKTTQIKNLTVYFNELGYEVELSREPGGTIIGEHVREILLRKGSDSPTAKTELFLCAAARAQHLEEKILPALKDGKVVITDRFSDSTIAYQGFGRGLGMEFAEQINTAATGGVLPDLTIYLDILPSRAMSRKQSEQNHVMDRIEEQDIAFHMRVYEGYQMLCKKYPKRICRVVADNAPEAVFDQIKTEVDKRLNIKGGRYL